MLELRNMSRSKGYINKKPIESSLELSNWGLSKTILRKYNRIGISKLFKWQMNCLRLDGVLDKHKNLVYSAHASVGKLIFMSRYLPLFSLAAKSEYANLK